MGGGGGEWVEPPNKFSKRGGLDKISTLRGGLLEKREATFFRKGCNFYKKTQLKSEIINGKEVLKQKYFSLS